MASERRRGCGETPRIIKGEPSWESISAFAKEHPNFYAVQIYGYEEPFCFPEDIFDAEIDFFAATLKEVMDCLCESNKEVGGKRVWKLYKPKLMNGSWIFYPVDEDELLRIDGDKDHR